MIEMNNTNKQDVLSRVNKEKEVDELTKKVSEVTDNLRRKERDLEFKTEEIENLKDEVEKLTSKLENMHNHVDLLSEQNNEVSHIKFTDFFSMSIS